MRTNRWLAPSAFFLAVIALSCASQREEGGGEGAPDGGLPSGHPAVSPTGSAPSDIASFEGVVRETLSSSGYTYARLETSQGEVWAAAPEMPLSLGMTVEIIGATPMGTFTSASLGRTFDEIYFAGAFLDASAPEDGVRGTAREVVSVSGYTYVSVERDGTDQWIAGPQTTLQEGETVVWVGGTAMGQFTSASLNRTFENILFVERIWVER